MMEGPGFFFHLFALQNRGPKPRPTWNNNPSTDPSTFRVPSAQRPVERSAVVTDGPLWRRPTGLLQCTAQPPATRPLLARCISSPTCARFTRRRKGRGLSSCHGREESFGKIPPIEPVWKSPNLARIGCWVFVLETPHRDNTANTARRERPWTPVLQVLRVPGFVDHA